MVTRRPDEFRLDHLLNGALIAAIVAVPFAFISTSIGVVVLIGLAFVCGWLGGRDAGLGSAGAGTFMFFFAATEPHSQFEIRDQRDQVLLVRLLRGVAHRPGARPTAVDPALTVTGPVRTRQRASRTRCCRADNFRAVPATKRSSTLPSAVEAP